VASEDAEDVLEAARGVDVGVHAALIGTVEEGAPRVGLKTGLGATRPLIMLAGDQLPRIC
jgi:hydrogenase maturation factor